MVFIAGTSVTPLSSVLCHQPFAQACQRHNHSSSDRGQGCFNNLAKGVVYRQVNTGAGRVRLIAIERNLVHTVGVDRQSGFEQLQPCPEYREAK